MSTTYLTPEQISSVQGMTSREAARYLGVGKTSINKYRTLYANSTTDMPHINAKILVLDIESKPHLVYTWGLWDQNVGLTQIVEDGGMICFAAKWLGESETMFYSEYEHGQAAMRREAHRLLSEADIVVTYNGDRYDIKRLNNEFLLAGMTPPKPYRSIDLFKINKAQFDLPSRKLDFIVQRTGLGQKLAHTGFELWVGCMNGDADAWKLMEEYNREDVRITESLYVKLLPWLKSVPHIGMFAGDGHVCPYCGSDALTEDGETHTQVQTYALFQCNGCGGWSRGTKTRGISQQTRIVV